MHGEKNDRGAIKAPPPPMGLGLKYRFNTFEADFVQFYFYGFHMCLCEAYLEYESTIISSLLALRMLYLFGYRKTCEIIQEKYKIVGF